MVRSLRGDRFSDLSRDGFDRPEIQRSVVLARSPNADERNIGLLHRTQVVVSRRKEPLLDRFVDQLLDAFLDDRAFPRANEVDLDWIRIHADDAMALFRETRTRNRSDVAQPKDADLHRYPLLVIR